MSEYGNPDERNTKIVERMRAEGKSDGEIQRYLEMAETADVLLGVLNIANANYKKHMLTD